MPRACAARRIAGIARIVHGWMSCNSTIAPGRSSRITLRATDVAVGCFRSSPEVADQNTSTSPSERASVSVWASCSSYGARKRRGRRPSDCETVYCMRTSSAHWSHCGSCVRRGCDQEWFPTAPTVDSSRAAVGQYCIRLPTRKNVACAPAARSSATSCSVYGPGPSSNVSATSLACPPPQYRGSPRRSAIPTARVASHCSTTCGRRYGSGPVREAAASGTATRVAATRHSTTRMARGYIRVRRASTFATNGFEIV